MNLTREEEGSAFAKGNGNILAFQDALPDPLRVVLYVPRKKVVITGGAGFIGSHLVDALLDRYEVTVLDDFSSGKISNLVIARRRYHGLSIIRGDIRDSRLVTHLLKGAAAVFHEAAIASVPKSIKRTSFTNEVNVDGTLNILNAAVANHVEKLVYASSCAVYGDGGSRSREDHLPAPASPYAASKLAGEYYCKSFYDAFGLETVILRYFNVYGPRQIPGPYSGVIVSFVERALAGDPLVIFGDGSQSRDFVHVSDVVRANLRALENNQSGGLVFNIGTGRATTVNQLARMVKEVAQKTRLRIVNGKPRPGDIEHSCADTSFARRMLGYTAKVTLREGLCTFVEEKLRLLK